MLKTRLFIRANGARVVFKNGQRYTLQVQLGEGKAQHGFHGVGAVAPAPVMAAANAQTHKRIARNPIVNHIQGNFSQQSVVI